MGAVTLMTQAGALRKARRTNCTDTSFDSLVPTLTEPLLDTAAGSASAQVAIDVIARPARDGAVQNRVRIYPIGAGSDDTTYVLRVYGWEVVYKDDKLPLWVPTILAGFTCTLSTAVGVAGSDVATTDRFADTIARVPGLGTDLNSYVHSPANNTPGFVEIDLGGVQKWEPGFDMTGATDGNVLYRHL